MHGQLASLLAAKKLKQCLLAFMAELGWRGVNSILGKTLGGFSSVIFIPSLGNLAHDSLELRNG